MTVRWNTTNRVRVDTERHINNLKYKNIVVMAQMENKSKVFVEKLGSLVANKRSIERVELNKEYYDKACERIKIEKQQLTLDL